MRTENEIENELIRMEITAETLPGVVTTGMVEYINGLRFALDLSPRTDLIILSEE